MITLSFEGWFQYRMATDPDPTDSRRGLSGYTFALPGEPDFDGVLHLQADEPGVCQRDFGPCSPTNPKVGVQVRAATRNGDPLPELVGADVMLPGSRLEERNGIVVRDDMFPIDPLQIQVRKNGTMLLDRTDLLDPEDPGLTILMANGKQIERRQCAGMTRNSFEVAEATGLPNATNAALIENRDGRRESLELLLAETEDPVRRAALETRIAQLRIVRQWWNLSAKEDTGVKPIDRRAYTLALQAFGWNIPINGPVAANTLGGDAEQHWPLSFWLGGWDGDALCGYIRGQLAIPLA